MTAQGKRWLFFIFGLFFLLFFPKTILAEVLINEFSALGEPDWVELYNSNNEVISLEGWLIKDSTDSNQIQLNGLICPQDFRKFDFSNRLNNGGDTIRLFDDQGDLKNSVVYFSELVPVHSQGESTGRETGGGGTWVVFGQPTPLDSPCQTLTPTNNPTPTVSLTPTPTIPPETPRGIYKINEVKNEDGDILSSVKVYVDGEYLHHYAPEELTFCEGCNCDGYVDCGFGQHEIRLEKSDYENWEEIRTINQGDNHQVDPVMIKASSSSSSTSTPISTLTPTPSLKPTPTLKKEKTPTPGGEVLGTQKKAYLLETPTPIEKDNKEATSSGKGLAKVFLISGAIFLFFGGLWVWYTWTGTSQDQKDGKKDKLD